MAKADAKKVNKNTDLPAAAPKQRKDKEAIVRLDMSKGSRVVLREARLASRDEARPSAERAAAKVAIAVAMSDADDMDVLDRADAADAAEEQAAKAVAELDAVKAKLGKSRDKVEQLQQEIEALKAKYESAEKLAEREESTKRLATFEAVVASLQSWGERVEGLASMLMAQSSAASATTTAVKDLAGKVDAIKIEAPIDPATGLQALSAELAAAVTAITERVGSGFGALPAAVAAAIPTTAAPVDPSPALDALRGEIGEAVAALGDRLGSGLAGVPVAVIAALPPAPAPVDHTSAIDQLRSELGAAVAAVGDRVGNGLATVETAAAADAGRLALADAVSALMKQTEELTAIARGSVSMSAAAVAILAKHVVKLDGIVADATISEMVALAKATLD